MRLRVSPPVLGTGVEAADRREEGRLFEAVEDFAAVVAVVGDFGTASD